MNKSTKLIQKYLEFLSKMEVGGESDDTTTHNNKSDDLIKCQEDIVALLAGAIQDAKRSANANKYLAYEDKSG